MCLNFVIYHGFKLRKVIRNILMMVLFMPSLAWAAVPVTQSVYVDGTNPQASDQNAGTEVLPFKTINKGVQVAVNNNRNNVGTRVLIKAGKYRESISLSGQQTDAPIVMEGIGQPIVSGSDVWTGWRQIGAVYSHSWPYKWGLAAVPTSWQSYVTVKDIVRRREMVFVNGKLFNQVLSYAELQQGSFYVDETGGIIYVQPPSDLNMSTAVIEVAVRPRIFSATGKANLTLKNLIFEHANPFLDDWGVWFYNCSNIVVEDCQFRWSNWNSAGFSSSSKLTIRRNKANNNGSAGLTTNRTRDTLFEDNEMNYNNWRGVKGGFTDWVAAGIKNLRMRNGTFIRQKCAFNDAHGLWFDTDCSNVNVQDASIYGNLENGIFIEASQGPFAVRTSRIYGNRNRGVRISKAAQVTLESNAFYDNGVAQIFLTGNYDTPWQVTDWETGALISIYWEKYTIRYNAIEGAKADQALFKMSPLISSLRGRFLSSFISDYNVWYHPFSTRVFQLYGGSLIDFTTWKSQTGQDKNSVFQDPGFQDPQNGNFNTTPGSPLIGMPGWSTAPTPVPSPPQNLRIIP
jgi:hypothetical protein